MFELQSFDLTMEINENTPVFPGDPEQEIKQFATIAKDGWNEKRLSFNSHFSTHIDAPYHMLESGKKLSEYPASFFFGEGLVIDARGQNPIEPDLLGVTQHDMVFFLTGHTDRAYSQDFFKNNPVISRKTAEALVERKVKMVGLDSFTPDNEPYEIHKLLFKNDIPIVENLVNLKPLAGKRFECAVLPLSIRDADGAPCRVIARL